MTWSASLPVCVCVFACYDDPLLLSVSLSLSGCVCVVCQHVCMCDLPLLPQRQTQLHACWWPVVWWPPAHQGASANDHLADLIPPVTTTLFCHCLRLTPMFLLLCSTQQHTHAHWSEFLGAACDRPCPLALSGGHLSCFNSP